MGSLSDRLSGTAPTVLVVEDEADIATFLGAFFRASGLHIEHLEPTDSEQVVRAVGNIGAAAVVLDVRLGALSGFDVLRALGEAGIVPELPVLVVSASDSADRRAMASDLGARAFVPKPFSVREVFALVCDLVGFEPSAELPHRMPAAHRMDEPDLEDEGLLARATGAVAMAQHTGHPCAIALVAAEGAAAGAGLAEVMFALGAGMAEGAVRPTGTLDEVVIIAEATEVAQLADTLSARVVEVGLDLGVALRAGVAGYPNDAHDATGLVAAARMALSASVVRGPVATPHH